MSSDMFDIDAKDPLTRERGKCMSKNCDVRAFTLALRACQMRLEKKPYTAEDCSQETVDLIEAVDKCVTDKAFVKLV